MRILYLCPKPPWPPIDGGSIAVWHSMEGMRALGHEVDVLALNTNKQYCPPASVPSTVREEYRYTLVDVDITFRPLRSLLRSFARVPYHVERFNSAAMAKVLADRLSSTSYDLVVLESLYTAPYLHLAKESGARVVIRCHNAEFMIWRKLARSPGNVLKRLFFARMARRIRRYELATLEACDGCACISTDDIQVFKREGSEARLYHVPFGMDQRSEGSTDDERRPSRELYHIGSMDWLPHQQAMQWFLSHVWPLVQARDSAIRCHLAGRGMPEWIAHIEQPGLVVHGGSIDAALFVRDKGILIAPSFSGSGIMVKVIEAMSAGKAIITTRNGARGLTIEAGTHMVISDSPSEWADHLVGLVNNDHERAAIGQRAMDFARREHDRIRSAEKLLSPWWPIIS